MLSLTDRKEDSYAHLFSLAQMDQRMPASLCKSSPEPQKGEELLSPPRHLTSLHLLLQPTPATKGHGSHKASSLTRGSYRIASRLFRAVQRSPACFINTATFQAQRYHFAVCSGRTNEYLWEFKGILGSLCRVTLSLNS